VSFCAHCQHREITDIFSVDTTLRAEFIKSTAMDVAYYVQEGHTYQEWVHSLMADGIPHSLACEVMDEVKERKGMIATFFKGEIDVLVYV